MSEETKAPEAEKPAKAAKVVQNGITKPEGPKTGRIWAIADQISQLNKRPATRKEVLEAAAAEGLSAGTAATQFGHWQKFYGVVAAKPVNPAPAPDAAPAVEPESAPAAE